MKADTKSNGTSSLKRHFNVCKCNAHKCNKDPTQGILQATQDEVIGTWRFDQDELRAAFAEMVIEDEQPFCFGEKPGLRKFMAKACPRFQLPSRRTCTRDTVRCYFQEKAKLKKFFKDSCQRVCLTTDCWTSQQQDGYMTVTASFIDDNLKMHKKVIGFFMVKGHKGDDIGKNVIRCMTEWGLDRVMTITVDNASANDTGIGYLRRQLSGTNIANGKYLHMRCAAHIVNLIVQDGLKEVDLSVKRVRAAVRYIRNGGSRIVKFKELIEEEKLTNKPFLKLDVPTRWNSTCIMLKAAIVYEKVFTRLVDEDMSYVIDLSEARDGFGHPDETDWENVKKMADFLEHFHDLTVRVSATLHITSHTFFHEIGEVHLLIQSWLNSTDVVQSAMGRRMKDKFDKYWGLWHTSNSNTIVNDKGRGKGKEKENINLLIFVAGCLDPRYKLSMYTKIIVEEIFGEERGQLVWEAIDTCVHELFEEYKKMYGPAEETSDAIDPVASKGGRGGKLKEVIAKRMKLGNASSNNTKSELDKYLAEETEDTEMKIDLLVWWKASEQRFPILSRLARDVLAIPISSIASESAFSTSGRILDDFGSSLTPFMLEALN
ncbi:zinc finger BED domain-containing protein RICESLEEPER 2-like [Panicum hallii]|uniref:zinc finger BED domain-containing protein RICESLEEPER 2-like n=1 Tax=Panicum hallii TaxID=206008 RepID=UPI000DF4E259|nr:zinc finger BED domain-containing protein RICESLEEPER 2-like [Panicum hallii]